MNKKSQMLSVVNIAEICGVARSTASYWITGKSLPAYRSGKKYMVAIEDLVVFLESMGRPVPRVLLENLGGIFSHPFKVFQNCWNYWKGNQNGRRCEKCGVFKNNISECFTARDNNKLQCPVDCSECQYFYEHYIPYICFIHQMAVPAAVIKNLYIWSGNKAWAELCGMNTKNLIGMGVEDVIHPDSIKAVINYEKRIQQGDTSRILKTPIYFEKPKERKREACLTISPLKQPSGACLATAEKVFNSSS